jgi:hypothetical protein
MTEPRLFELFYLENKMLKFKCVRCKSNVSSKKFMKTNCAVCKVVYVRKFKNFSLINNLFINIILFLFFYIAMPFFWGILISFFKISFLSTFLLSLLVLIIIGLGITFEKSFWIEKIE